MILNRQAYMICISLDFVFDKRPCSVQNTILHLVQKCWKIKQDNLITRIRHTSVLIAKVLDSLQAKQHTSFSGLLNKAEFFAPIFVGLIPYKPAYRETVANLLPGLKAPIAGNQGVRGLMVRESHNGKRTAHYQSHNKKRTAHDQGGRPGDKAGETSKSIPFLVPIALFATLNWRGLGTRNEGLWRQRISSPRF